MPHESRLDLQRGDSTMPQLKPIRLPFALAAALAAAPLAAGDVEKPVTLEQTAKDVKELKDAQKKATDEVMQQLKAIQDQLKSIDTLRKDVDAVRGKMQDVTRELELSAQMHGRNGGDLTDLRGQVKQLHDDLERARAQAGKLEQELTNQAARCDALTRDVAAMRRQAADGTRQSARMTDATGTIRLFNTFGAPVSVVINGRSYRVEPGETYTLASQPLGPFTYEVLAIQPPRTVTLTPDRPYDIEVYDRSQGPVKTPLRAIP
jgi:septal ring factor EnvC (AmiA/AmiB activator)